MSDLISRQDAIDAICKACSMEEDYHKCDGYPETSTWCDELVALRALPSAQPERPKGKWIYNSPVTMKCNQCGLVIKDWDWHRFKYCPNCGTDMRGEKE